MKTNLYATSTETFEVNGHKYLTEGKEYKVWKILHRSDMRIVIIDDMGNLTDWGARLFTFKEV